MSATELIRRIEKTGEVMGCPLAADIPVAATVSEWSALLRLSRIGMAAERHVRSIDDADGEPLETHAELCAEIERGA